MLTVIKKLRGNNIANLTETIEVLPVWTNLTSNAGLLADGKYICQNIGAKEVFLFEGETIPADEEIGVLLPKHEYIGILQIGTELKFWVRVNNYDPAGQSGRIVISAIA